MRPFLVLWLVAACAASRESHVHETIVAGHSREGRPIEARVLGDGERTVLMLASIHGNEPAGTPLLHRLAGHLSTHPELLEGCRVVLVPIANPDGHAKRTRRNAAGIDVNRNFETANSRSPAPLSEPESRALVGLLRRYRPAVVVSLHQPLRCVDYDGPAKDLASAMAAAGGLPVRKLGAKPGSLGSYVGLELGLPIVTVELPRNASRLGDDELWRRYGEMLLLVHGTVHPSNVQNIPRPRGLRQ